MLTSRDVLGTAEDWTGRSGPRTPSREADSLANVTAKRPDSLEACRQGRGPPSFVPTLAYDGTNRLTSWIGAAIGYDANGSMTSFGSTTYTWNDRNQMTATSAGSASFSYDALGRRTAATISGANTAYLYDGLNPVTMGSNFMLAGAGLDEIYARINGSGTTSFLRDGLNNTLALSNSSDATTVQYAYSPYGDTAKTGTDSTPLDYTGRENDAATGLYYYRARYYSPQLGRFIGEDPIGLGGGTNFYAYVGGDPISHRDPTGRCPWCVGAAVGGVLDLIYQLNKYHGDIGCVSWGQVAGAAVLGAIGGELLGDLVVSDIPEATDPLPPGWNENWEWRYPEGDNSSAPRWFDEDGGEWRYHDVDSWHDTPHWDYNSWEQWNSPWQNIYK